VGTIERIYRRGPKKHLFYDDGVYFAIRLLEPCQVARRPRSADRNDSKPLPFEAVAGKLVNLQNGFKTEHLLDQIKAGKRFGTSRLPTIKLIVRDRMIHPTNQQHVLWNGALWNADLYIWEDTGDERANP
jgi:hypothetical protein